MIDSLLELLRHKLQNLRICLVHARYVLPDALPHSTVSGFLGITRVDDSLLVLLYSISRRDESSETDCVDIPLNHAPFQTGTTTPICRRRRR